MTPEDIMLIDSSQSSVGVMQSQAMSGSTGKNQRGARERGYT